MTDPSLYWQKISAIGQVAGAIATFAAVAVSLWLSLRIQRPRLKLIVGERLIFADEQLDQRVLMFQIANVGDRTIQVKGFGWRTGRLSWGPRSLRRKYAVQVFDRAVLPIVLQPAESAQYFADMKIVLAHCRERTAEPFFSRDWPIFGRQAVTIWASISTSEGYNFYVRLELATCRNLVQAEIEALLPKQL